MSLRKQVDVEFTIDRETIPDILVEIGEVVLSQWKTTDTTPEIATLEEENKHLQADLALVSAQLTEERNNIKPSAQLKALFHAGKTFHCKTACKAAKRSNQKQIQLWIYPHHYQELLDSKSERLCSYCHGWRAQRTEEENWTPIENELVTILPHDKYKYRVRGLVKALSTDAIQVLPKNHGQPVWLDRKYVRRVLAAK